MAADALSSKAGAEPALPPVPYRVLPHSALLLSHTARNPHPHGHPRDPWGGYSIPQRQNASGLPPVQDMAAGPWTSTEPCADATANAQPRGISRWWSVIPPTTGHALAWPLPFAARFAAEPAVPNGDAPKQHAVHFSVYKDQRVLYDSARPLTLAGDTAHRRLRDAVGAGGPAGCGGFSCACRRAGAACGSRGGGGTDPPSAPAKNGSCVPAAL